MGISRDDVRVDVTDAAGLNTRLETAISVFTSETVGESSSPIVMFAFPGGTYGRGYYDLSVPNRHGYSLARHIAEAGSIVIACDYIGIGDSTPYEPFAAITPDVVLRSVAATVDSALGRLHSGTLTDRLPPIGDPFLVGCGHSMGGLLLTLLQARHHTFDAVAILGLTQLRLEQPDDLLMVLDERERRHQDLPPDPTWTPRSWFPGFHAPDVPDDVLAADRELSVRVYPWVFASDNPIVYSPIVPHAARKIDVPVFLGFGEHDASPSPHREVGAYPASSDITTFVLPRAAHCFNFASERERFFERLSGWVRAVAGSHAARDVRRGQPLEP